MAGEDKNTKVKVIKAGAYTKKVRKLDADGLSFNSKEVEDEFQQAHGVHDIIPPPFNPRWLKLLVTHNNTLNQAISAMEINIDGSGSIIEAKEEDEDDGKSKDSSIDKQIKQAEDFFEEVAPGMSFLTLRRKMRRDIESCGYGFIEVIRNLLDEVVALKRVDPSTVRLLKLKDRILVEKTLLRGGQELKVNMYVRERRYLQVIGNQQVYFSEFQASRKLNKGTGDWESTAKGATKIAIEEQATELMYFTVDTEANGPYGIPRWINNLPSVLGSRKAEEQNLDFFDNGGVPPVIITVMGGKMAGDVKKQLNNFLSGKTPNTRIAVLEAQADDGAIDGASSKLKIDVQRFGSEKINDSMFENYDEKSSERIRSSFRLPPLFIGKVRDFNFATAITAYLIAESQVFQPERMEFDEVVTRFINTELKLPDIQYRSLPIVLSDAKVQWEALKFSYSEGTIGTEQYINAVNSITGIGLVFDEEFDRKPEPEVPLIDPNNPPAVPAVPAKGAPAKVAPKSDNTYTIHKDSKDITDLIQVANDIVKAVGGMGDELSTEDKSSLQTYTKMDDQTKAFVRDLVSMKVMDNIEIDRTGANELLDGCLTILDESECDHGED